MANNNIVLASQSLLDFELPVGETVTLAVVRIAGNLTNTVYYSVTERVG